MSGTVALVGVFAGVAVWAAVGVMAARSCYEAAASEAQRLVLRRLFRFGGPYAAALMALVVLAGLQSLPGWVYILASVCWFGALLPALAWAHNRLEAAESGLEADLRPAF
jgi:hypothetical protein